MTKIFGIESKNGRLTVCRAKPENRGKGNCPHESHLELTEEDLKDGYVQKFNEKLVAQEESQLRATLKTTPEGTAISEEDLERGAAKVASSFKGRDFSFIQNFYNDFGRAMNAKERKELLSSDPVENMEAYLKSDQGSALKLRSFLGEEVDPRELSEILVQQVGAMTASLHWSPKRRNSLQRILLSSTFNDMTPKRYVASVLFFGGRCCYCNRVLHKGPPTPGQATGEHLTPISGETQAIGATRYGNMALACLPCNHERGSQELTQWLASTTRIKPEDKPQALGRIQAFRDFALYDDFTVEESQKIREKVAFLREELHRLRSSGVPQTDLGKHIRPLLAEAQEELRGLGRP